MGNSGREGAPLMVESKPGHSSFNTLALFIFTLDHKHFALDADLIQGLHFVPHSIDLYEDRHLFLLHEKEIMIVSLGYLFQEKIERYLKPRLVQFTLGHKIFATIIEEPRAFYRVDLQAIHPLPDYISHMRGNGLFWGLVEFQQDLVVLIDFNRVGHLFKSSKLEKRTD